MRNLLTRAFVARRMLALAAAVLAANLAARPTIPWIREPALVEAARAQSASRPIPGGVKGFQQRVAPFFKRHCVKCHGARMAKGEIRLDGLQGEARADRDLARWEVILGVLQRAEMPPEDQPQPPAAERQAVVKWIEAKLRHHIHQAKNAPAAPSARRLTNFEYQNTLRDLLGFELKLAKYLPEDPVKPYQFNNTAEFMLIGPEQMDRYLENARRAMTSAIVDPGKPKVHRTVRKWRSDRSKNDGKMQPDEIGVYGGMGRRAPDRGMALKTWPATGQYRIRVRAAAILTPDTDAVPLRLVMGTQLRSDSGTGDYESVGTVHLSNEVNDVQTFEFRGRIENHPVQAGKNTARGRQPPRIYLYPQNLFDNGQLNDHRRSAFDKSWNLSTPRVVVQSIEFEAPVFDSWPPRHHRQILFDSPLREKDPEAYLHQVLERFMSRAFRRPATADEVKRFAKVFHILESDFDSFEGALRETLALVLISPKFLYHTVADGKVVSRQYALASKLSYFLWGSMPDKRLLDLAASGKLDDPRVIEAQVLRLLADERSHAFVDNFTTQWLSIAKMKAVNINQDLFPRFLYYVHVGERRGQEVLFRPTIRDYMHEETVGFVAELIRRNASVSSLVDSDFAFLNEPLAAHYGVQGVRGIRLRPVPLKPENRLGGLLTHASVLIGNGTGSAPHPIYRAVWLREAILGDHVKDPPAEVPALSESAGDSVDTAVTIKDLLALHRRKESCRDCHARLDPWGIPFERYNAVGRYQPRVPKNGVRIRGLNARKGESYEQYRQYLARVNQVQVEADARVPRGPRIDGMRELKNYLLRHRRDDIAENVIRRLLSYALGRKLTYRDRFSMERLHQQVKRNDYKLRDIVLAICQSETFRGTTARPKNEGVGERAPKDK